ncbi:MAG TPA: aminotransferase class V-fold PLP-dependent enzyme [Longimicrobiales bacterium]|nr:aminotransferase class V-fold PLP-dependent enzyme [Longimicrobiales bacterium]
MNELLRDAATRAHRYLSGLDHRTVEPAADAEARLAHLRHPLPDGPAAPAEVLRILDEVGSPATVASAGPRYFGFVTGGALPAALAANWLAGAWDQNAHYVVGSPVAAALEEVALGWILDAVGLPPSWHGGFVTGTTMGNFCGLVAARHEVLERAGWDVEADGLPGAPEITVVVGAEAHSTLHRALSLAGLGAKRVITVPVDDQGRMRPGELPDVSGPAIVCAQAGNVNSGAFDPLEPIAAWARQRGAWLHVDGAFGFWAAASPKLRPLVAGMGHADSCATDLHKWLNVPYDNGLVLFRDAAPARAALALSAAYLPDDPTRQPCDFTPESSRRARGVDVWAALRSLGRSGLAGLIEGCCGKARRFADGLGEAGFEVLNEVVLNQVVVAFGDDDTTRRVIAGVQREGTCWAGGTTWRGRAAMRISVSSWATTDADVESSLDAILRVAAETP